MELIIVQDVRFADCACIFPNLESCLKDCPDPIDDLIFYEFELNEDNIYTEVEPIIALEMIQTASENSRIYNVNMDTILQVTDRLSEKALEKYESRPISRKVG